MVFDIRTNSSDTLFDIRTNNGDITQIFKINLGIRNNNNINLDIRRNNNDFVPNLIQELIQVKIEYIQDSCIPGNEPIKYMNYHNSIDENSITTNKTINSTLSLKSDLPEPNVVPSMDCKPPTNDDLDI